MKDSQTKFVPVDLVGATRIPEVFDEVEPVRDAHHDSVHEVHRPGGLFVQ